MDTTPDREPFAMQIEMYTQDCFLKTLKQLELTNILKVVTSTLVNGFVKRNMEKECINIPMEMFTKEITKVD